MSQHFLREKHLVEQLMRQLGVCVNEFPDPNAEAGHETGTDVIAVVSGRRIGIQVTVIATGDIQGQARAEERKIAREYCSGGVHGAWAQNDPNKVLAAIVRSVSRKVEIAKQHDFGNVDEVWLLVTCGEPEMGAVASTLVVTQWLSAETLNTIALVQLSNSKYSHAFLQPILGTEQALYWWEAQGKWQTVTQEEVPGMQGPSLRDVIRLGSEWLVNPEGACDRQVQQCLREFRGRCPEKNQPPSEDDKCARSGSRSHGCCFLSGSFSTHSQSRDTWNGYGRQAWRPPPHVNPEPHAFAPVTLAIPSAAATTSIG